MPLTLAWASRMSGSSGLAGHRPRQPVGNALFQHHVHVVVTAPAVSSRVSERCADRGSVAT